MVMGFKLDRIECISYKAIYRKKSLLILVTAALQRMQWVLLGVIEENAY